jgi:uncharacterized membrane protein YczE
MKNKGWKKMNFNMVQWIKRVVVYCLGLFMMALGVAFSVKSNLGVSPVNSIPYVVSLITGVDQGLCVTVIFCGFIFLQFLILLKKFKIRSLLQIIASSIFGYFVTAANRLTVVVPPCANYPMRLVYLFISIVLVAIGVALYLKPNLISLPGEGVMQALVDRFGIRFPNAKTGFDTTMVIVAAALSLIAFHRLNGVREGTIIAAVGVGQMMKIWNKLFDRSITEFLK